MGINEYDECGRTPLMNAAIDGDLDKVRQLLEAGADPDRKDRSFGTTKAVNFAGRLAGKSDIHRQIHELLVSVSANSQAGIEDAKESSAGPVNTDHEKSAWPYETIRTIRGHQISRLRSSIFYVGGIASIPIGIYILSKGQPGGGFFVLFLAPCLLLYPAIRFLFGGRDSIAAAVTTVVVEEVLKNEVRKSANKKNR